MNEPGSPLKKVVRFRTSATKTAGKYCMTSKQWHTLSAVTDFFNAPARTIPGENCRGDDPPRLHVEAELA